VTTDVLVLGSGIAGLSVALRLAETTQVTIATKLEAIESNTRYAQGGIATVTDKSDSFDLHVADTLKSGAGLCHLDAVNECVRSGPDQVAWLIQQGVSFSTLSKDAEIEFDLGREGGHSRRRVLHVRDLTGLEVERVLLDRARNHPNITILNTA